MIQANLLLSWNGEGVFEVNLDLRHEHMAGMISLSQATTLFQDRIEQSDLDNVRLHLWSGQSPYQLNNISVVLTGHMLKTYLQKHMQTFVILFICLIKTHQLAKCINEARIDLWFGHILKVRLAIVREWRVCVCLPQRLCRWQGQQWRRLLDCWWQWDPG